MNDEKLIGLTLIKLNLTGRAFVILYIYTNTSCDQVRYMPGAIAQKYLALGLVYSLSELKYMCKMLPFKDYHLKVQEWKFFWLRF
jgi:hypothetical protein